MYRLTYTGPFVQTAPVGLRYRSHVHKVPRGDFVQNIVYRPFLYNLFVQDFFSFVQTLLYTWIIQSRPYGNVCTNACERLCTCNIFFLSYIY